MSKNMTEKTSPAADPPPANEAPLESWKEIAAYLKRDTRTVRRWEKSEGLPVRRHLHQARSSVFAYPSELDAWWTNRQPRLEKTTASFWRPAPVLAAAAVLLLSLLSVGSSLILTPPGLAAQASAGMVARRIWAGTDVDSTGTVSSDGRYLSFTDWETGDLAIRNLATGENQRITNKGSWTESPEYADWSVVSPDGSRVAYTWSNKPSTTNASRYDLRIVPLGVTTQATPRVIYRNDEVPYLQPHDWSPDGARIVTVLWRPNGTYQMALISAADGSAQILKSLEWRLPGKLSFSPNGRYIAYDVPVSEDSPDRDIFIISTDGRQEVPLPQTPAIDYDPAWTPDGRRILFASDRRGNTSVWMIPVADGKPQGAPELLKPDMGAIRALGFSRDGSYYYGVRTPTEDVYVAELNPQTGELSSTPERFTERFLGSNIGGVWSPDGRKLAYFSRRSPFLNGPGNMAVVIRSLDTGEEREFFSNLEFNYRWPIARWFPDGRSLLLSTKDRRGSGSLHRMDAQTGTVTPVLQSLSAGPPAVDAFPCISPDGRTIYYFQSAEGTEATSIMAYDTDTGRQQELERSMSRRRLESLALSRDGKQLAFVVSQEGVRSLKVLPMDGGEPREVFRAEQGGDEVAPFGIDWTHDDRFILFIRRDITAPRTDLWRVSPDGGLPQRILSGDGLGTLLLPRVHPEGRRITFTKGRRERNEVWVMENLVPGATAGR